MTIEILATQIELTPAIRDYVEQKIGSLEKFMEHFEQDHPVKVFVEVARTSKRHRHGEVYYAEATIPITGKTLRAECSDADLYAAIDGLKDLLKLEVTKVKGRQEDRDHQQTR